MKKILFSAAILFISLSVNADIIVRGKYKEKNNGRIKCKGSDGVCIRIHTISGGSTENTSFYFEINNDGQSIPFISGSSFSISEEIVNGALETTITINGYQENNETNN